MFYKIYIVKFFQKKNVESPGEVKALIERIGCLFWSMMKRGKKRMGMFVVPGPSTSSQHWLESLSQ